MELFTFALGFLSGMLVTDIVITIICYKKGFRWMK